MRVFVGVTAYQLPACKLVSYNMNKKMVFKKAADGEVKEVAHMKAVTLEAIYNKVVNLERELIQIKKSLMEEPELREEFILKMKDIDLEKSIRVKDFGKRYGLK